MNSLLAQTSNPALGGIASQSGVDFFADLLPSLVTLTFVAGAVIFFFMLLFGGIRWVSSGGDKNAIESARGIITNGIIGIFILFSSFAIINLVGCFFKTNFLQFSIGTYSVGFANNPVCPSGITPPAPTPTPTPVSNCSTGFCAIPGNNSTCVAGATLLSYGVSCQGSGCQTANCECSECLINTPTPGPNTPTPTPTNTGSCQCDLYSVVVNGCANPSTAVCTGNFSCSCVFPTPTVDPNSAGNISGVVNFVITSPDTMVIPSQGALVRLMSGSTQLSSTTTGSLGQYTFYNLPSGNYATEACVTRQGTTYYNTGFANATPPTLFADIWISDLPSFVVPSCPFGPSPTPP